MTPAANSPNPCGRRARRSRRRPRSRHTLSVCLAALALVLSAFCDASSAATTSPGAAQLRADLAYARCMRSHGVLNFPDPNADGRFPPFQADVSAQITAGAQRACKHLLPHGGDSGPLTQGDQRKTALALKIAHCMRAHGFPTYPDPPGPGASSQGSGRRFDGTGIDTKSPRFQAAEAACERQSRQALGIPAAK